MLLFHPVHPTHHELLTVRDQLRFAVLSGPEIVVLHHHQSVAGADLLFEAVYAGAHLLTVLERALVAAADEADLLITILGIRGLQGIL